VVKFVVLGLFLLSFLLFGASYWQFFVASLRANQAMQLDFALAFMIFAATTSGVREVVQGVLLGYSMAAADLIVKTEQ
jgi:hypothetical protein